DTPSRICRGGTQPATHASAARGGRPGPMVGGLDPRRDGLLTRMEKFTASRRRWLLQAAAAWSFTSMFSASAARAKDGPMRQVFITGSTEGLGRGAAV